jgi:probable F420-dependent oxidoreductase
MKFTLAAPYVGIHEYVVIAIEAEKCGFDVMTIGDHVVNFESVTEGYTFNDAGERPWNEASDWPDVFSTMSYVAAKTHRIELMTSVLVLPMRNPLQVAQQISTVSQLAQRRIWFGIGVGWSGDECRLMGQDFGNRGRRSVEMIEIMRKVWQGKFVEHHGDYYDFDRLIMLPPPAMRIPILQGGAADVVLRRAAKFCDGWISPPWTVEESLKTVARIRTMLKEEGRDREPFEFVLVTTDWANPDSIKRAEDAGIDNLMCASPWLEQAFIPGGARDTSDLHVKLDGVRRFADAHIAARK